MKNNDKTLFILGMIPIFIYVSVSILLVQGNIGMFSIISLLAIGTYGVSNRKVDQQLIGIFSIFSLYFYLSHDLQYTLILDRQRVSIRTSFEQYFSWTLPIFYGVIQIFNFYIAYAKGDKKKIIEFLTFLPFTLMLALAVATLFFSLLNAFLNLILAIILFMIGCYVNKKRKNIEIF